MEPKLDPVFGELDLSIIEEVLGKENMPDLIPGPIGSFRLNMALQNRFGKNYRMNSGAMKAKKNFEEQTSGIRDLLKLKEKLNGQRG